MAGARRRGLQVLSRLAAGVQIDHPANDPIFATMEQIGMVAASPHVANPCGTYGRRTEWFAEPVEFWRQQHAWENVLKKHPRLVVVNAHMLWLCYSDEQLDYLRYMLKTYPNLHVDLATTPVFLHAVGRDNLREFMIEYADRILFGTDMGSKWFVPVLDKQLPKVGGQSPAVPAVLRVSGDGQGAAQRHQGRAQDARAGVAVGRAGEDLFPQRDADLSRTSREALTQLGYFGNKEAAKKAPCP